MVKKILSITLAMLMLTSMFAVNTLAVSTTSETAVFHNTLDDLKAYYIGFRSTTYEYSYTDANARYYMAAAGNGSLTAVEDINGATGSAAKRTARDASARVKIAINQSKYEEGAKYKVTAAVTYVAGASAVETTSVTFGTMKLNKLGATSDVSNKSVVTLTNGVEQVVSSAEFTYNAADLATTNASSESVTGPLDAALCWDKWISDIGTDAYLLIDDIKLVKVTTSSYGIFEDGEEDFESLTGATLEKSVDYTTTDKTATISQDVANSGSNSLKAIVSGATHAVRLYNAIPASFDGKVIEVKMMVYPTTANVGTYQFQIENGSGGIRGIEGLFTFAETADPANNVLAINQWNEVRLLASANSNYPHIRIRGNSGASEQTFYIDDYSVTEYAGEDIYNADFDAGYYAETDAEDAEKSGVIAVEAECTEDLDYVTSYGVYVYVADDEENRNDTLTSTDVAQLKTDLGKFNALVTNIPEANFATDVAFKPFAVIGGKYFYANAFTYNVNNAIKWLGQISE